ncbi:hypothetical protein PanWU01x14_240270 [Parasponia andersonii]|uniref:Uncharacterized protein n=1 Tax=Parasponia andersonii TaxID=3476 RepID=A0A2P5BGX4_PARAD|nr:hypothetical protein PanWU01x14_240270 [Parasponia andersonii]
MYSENREFSDLHKNRDQTVEILSRFVCHRSGVDPDPNWTSYISNLAILGARNSVKRSVYRIEAPVRKLVFHTRTIEGLELVLDPPGDRQRYLKDSIAWCRYSVKHREFYSVALRAPPSVKVRKLARSLITSDYLPIWQEIPITELFFPEVTIFLLDIVCSPPLPSSSGGVQCDLGDQEE